MPKETIWEVTSLELSNVSKNETKGNYKLNLDQLKPIWYLKPRGKWLNQSLEEIDSNNSVTNE